MSPLSAIPLVDEPTVPDPGALRRVEALPPELVEASREVLHTHARSFTLASWFLPRACRDEAAVVYALCRLIDDTADEADDLEVARRDLAQLDAELAGTEPARPLVAAFRLLEALRGVPTAAARELITGVATDLSPVRVADDRELLRYCYRVAGTVGLMMCGVLGVTEARALPYAVDLGLGMQLSNICRDVKEDAAMGRVYLPASRLEAHGSSTQAVLEGTARPEAVSAVVDELLALAEHCYARARLGMRDIPFRPRLAILVASRVYRAIGLRLQRVHGSDPLHGRTVVPRLGKLREVCLALLSAFHPVILGLVEGRDPGGAHQRHLVGLRGLPALVAAAGDARAPEAP